MTNKPRTINEVEERVRKTIIKENKEFLKQLNKDIEKAKE